MHDEEADIMLEFFEGTRFPNDSILYEDATNQTIQETLSRYAQQPVKDQSFYCTVAAWVPPIVNQQIIKFTQYQILGKVLQINDDQLIMEFNGAAMRFPSTAGQNTHKINCTLLFDTKNDQEKTQTLLDLKFNNDWRIVKDYR